MENLSKSYRVRRGRTSGVVLILGLLLLIGLPGLGCTGFAESERQGEADGDRARTTAFELFDSMVEVFEEETAGVEVVMENSLMVVSHFEEIEEARRRRFVGRVVPVGGNIGVRISAEYQVVTAVDDEGRTWEFEPREDIAEEASPLELRLARQVERHFHRRRS